MAKSIVTKADFPTKQQAFISFAQNVSVCLTGNTTFPNLPVTLAILNALIATLVTAQALADKRGEGAATARNTARTHVETALLQNLAYVRAIIAQMPPADAQAALAGSGYLGKKASTYAKPDYSVDDGELSGTAEANVKAAGRHGSLQYCHQSSLTGTAPWVDYPPTLDTKFLMTGFPVGTVVSFRYRILKKGVYGNWSQILTLLVR
jgi:hypothetical protein